MFDSLKKALKTFTGKVAEESELREEPAKTAGVPGPDPVPGPVPIAPRPSPVARDTTPAAGAPAPSKPAKLEIVEDDDDDLLPDASSAASSPRDRGDDELKAEIEALEKPDPAPTKAAPASAAAPAAKAPAVFEPVTKQAPPPAPARAQAPATAPERPPMPQRAPAPPAPGAARPAPTPSAPKPAAPAKAPSKSIQLDKIDDLLWDLELSLLESDVALPVVEEIKETLKRKLQDVRVASVDDVPRAVEQALRASLLEALSVKPIDFDAWLLEALGVKKPVVIMFVGVNGTGKTTSIGRIAFRLKENGFTSVMAAGDTFRAGAIQQLEKHAEKVGVSFIKTTAGGDPAAVAFDAIEHAKGRMKDVVLLDTAGRMQTNTNLMDEMKKIKRVAKPDLIVFVGDSLAGNDAVEQAVQFDKAVGIDAVILTKVDTDAKGGAALSIAKAVGKPILFLGVGQEYGDIVPYDPQWMVDRIFEAA